MQSQLKYDDKTGVILTQDNTSIKDIESKVLRYKNLQYQQKVIEAEMAIIKKDIIDKCFKNNEEYFDSNNVLCATYKSQIRIFLDQTKLKNEMPNIYDEFSTLKEIKVLLIK